MISTISLPVLDQVAASLKTSGQYRTELTADDVTSIMRTIAVTALAGQNFVGGRVERLENRIADERGTTSATIQISRPMTAKIDAALTLVNDAAPDRIKLESETISQDAAFPARLVLQAMDLGGRVRRALADPNRALQNALAEQLGPRGVTVTGVGLHFTSSTLSVDVRGGVSSREL